MTNQTQIGATLEAGLVDWQILQQDSSGYATLKLAGRWQADEAAAGQPCVVEVRVVAGDTGVAVQRALDWQAATTTTDGQWQIALRVPAGGLYRLETRCRVTTQPEREWALRGDMRHFWGVGDLWVIAGQSNSAGYGRGAVYDPPELGIHLFRNSDQWTLAFHPMNDATATAHTVNRERANPAHSPYLHFARLLKQQLNYPIGLVQTALGGSPLSAWNPTEVGEAGLFHNMVHCVAQAGGAVKGILWYQGESDSGPGLAESYAARFQAAVEAWRQALQQPGLAVLTVQLNRYFPPPPASDEAGARAWSLVRDVQRQLANQMTQVAVVPTLDLPLSALIHTSPAGNLLLGERLARAALGLVYGQPLDHRAPDLQSARLLEPGDLVELSFANVTDRLDNLDRAANCFKVEDSAGDVPIREVIYPMNHTIQLRLARPLAANAVVHGAYGYNPALAPVDMDRVLPILGFYGVVIEA
jgi:hypothetical protein